METSRATSHSNPTFFVEGVMHYGVTNIPGAVPRTSTYALSNATLPYAALLANRGFEGAIAGNRHLARGVNTFEGRVTHQAVAECFDLPFLPLEISAS